MKSQDILVLLKLVSLARQEQGLHPIVKSDVRDYSPAPPNLLMQARAPYVLPSRQNAPPVQSDFAAQHSMRALASAIGISKSEVSQSLQRCYESGLARPDRKSGLPRAYADALAEFLLHGIRYVFPVKLAEVTRGMVTAWAAPVMQGVLQSAGELVPVWPDALGEHKGQALAPLFKSASYAAAQDDTLYALLALTDSIRIGLARERGIASQLLEKMLLEVQ